MVVVVVLLGRGGCGVLPEDNSGERDFERFSDKTLEGKQSLTQGALALRSVFFAGSCFFHETR